jgi:deaminated glutathione amidase
MPRRVGAIMNLVLATCQFPVSRRIEDNFWWILRQMRQAQRKGAHLAHFCECSLTGYTGVEFESFDGFDWNLLERSLREIQSLARELKLWVVLGAAHRLSGRHRPHNSLYVIDNNGRLRDRYDKMFCTGVARSNNHNGPLGRSHDLTHYSPGDHFVTFQVRGVRVGLQICHDFRYPELYRRYKRLGVQVILHSYHNGHTTKAKLKRSGNIWGVIVPPTMQAYAANNYMWISATNTCARENCWPSFVVRPDGVISARLRLHQAGILITNIAPRTRFYDASEAWRDRAMRGIYHSGMLVANDPRSTDRRSF